MEAHMITAGVDAGLRNIKVLILNDGRPVAAGIGPSGGGGRGSLIDGVWREALADAGLSASDVGRVVATGQGKRDVSFADRTVVEAVAAARAARFILPGAVSVIDAGADQTRVVTLDGGGVREIVLNQKCMAGLGLLLETVAWRLDMSMDDMGALSHVAAEDALVNDGCPVFAEQGALELLNRGVEREKVAAAVIDAVVVRLNSILNDKIVPEKDGTVFIGGVAGNGAVVSGLKSRSGIDFVIPENPVRGGALGAALIAADEL
jgi:predicted CoA-substrate-specific enzyme activase